MNATIYEMIKQLKLAKKKIGGDKPVSFWKQHNPHTFFVPSEQMSNSVSGKICGDDSEVSFEIN